MNNNKRDRFNDDERMLADYAKLLSHPARVAIIRLLAEKKEIKTGNISDFLPISRPTVSRHLRELKELGVIDGTIDGLQIHYCLNMSRLQQMRDTFTRFFQLSITDFVCSC